jgi:hypothetical protein
LIDLAPELLAQHKNALQTAQQSYALPDIE